VLSPKAAGAPGTFGVSFDFSNKKEGEGKKEEGGGGVKKMQRGHTQSGKTLKIYLNQS